MGFISSRSHEYKRCKSKMHYELYVMKDELKPSIYLVVECVN